MRAPISFTYGNCVFAEGLTDVWAAFAVEVSSYQWLSEDGKRARFLALLGALEATEADVQILRVGRRPDVEQYAREAAGEPGVGGSGSGRAHVRARRRYVEEHARRLHTVGGAQPAVFVLVSLRDPERDVASYVSKAAEQGPRDWWAGLGRMFSVRDRRLLKASELERARVRADQAHARLADFLPVRRRAASSCSGWCAGRSAAAWASRRSTACTSRVRWSSSATARRCWRRSRAT